jgi:hypothetical protein
MKTIAVYDLLIEQIVQTEKNQRKIAIREYMAPECHFVGSKCQV